MTIFFYTYRNAGKAVYLKTVEAIMETAQMVPEWKSTADEIWALLRETAQRQAETDRIVKETAQQIKETDRQMKETDRQMKETSKKMEETDKRVGKLTDRFGETIEYMVMPNLISKFYELGFSFTKASQPKITDREHGLFMEVDAFLENGDKAMAVEVKVKPQISDINDHIERMEKLRKYADLRNDKRVYLGAIAGVVFSESARIYALKNGFYVIEPSGDTFNIIEPKGEYYPHEW
jgi:hypothetical protein